MPHQSGSDHNQYLTDRLGKRLIGGPIYFTAGQFAGKIIHARLQEMQAPVFGRKTISEFREARVDRRPLDPPPVAWLRLFEVFNIGTACETQLEMNYDDIDPSGLMCTVELFPVPSPESMLPNATTDFALSPVDEIWFSKSPDNATTKLVGTTFVQADSIPWKGRTCLLFTFADLAVKIEGFFILKYRFFDIFSTPGDDTDPPIQAECCSAPLRIYSTKVCPRLGPSTELSKHLAHYGVRLNVRATERKRKYQERDVRSPFTTQILRDQAKSESADDERAAAT
ncbi:velvet factor-domain-containing protein [Mycena albidolilacea]|uniref:Velvet factor-domain-containing protein n=1 Tax=Mycena albidolilacea TaxID=1033008 RepID=A0AAD6Z5S4_9AGAR|nr:velvet factor-domain-containing protein [Mycena albidolilacea]